MRKNYLSSRSAVTLLVLVGMVFFYGTGAAGLTVKKGQKAFPIEGKDLEGRKLSLTQYKGKLVLLDFWATWCPPCRAEIPIIKKVYEKYHKQGFEVIGIALDNDAQEVIDFVKEHEIPWRQVLDRVNHNRKNGNKYGVKAIPTAILVAPDGTVIDTLARGSRLEKLVAKHITSVTNKKPIKIEETPAEKAAN